MTHCSGRNIKIGVVGTGFAGHVHVPAFRSVTGCEIVSIFSKRAEKAREISKKLSIPQHYTDWRTMIEKGGIDAISIAVPPDIQTDIILFSLSKGKHVFCEKPLGTNTVSVLKTLEVAKKASLANMVDLEFPEIDTWRKAKMFLDSGTIGDLEHIAVSWQLETYANRFLLDSWKSRAENGGGALNSFGSHVLYYLEWFAGEISAISCELGKDDTDTRSGDTAVSISMDFVSKAIGVVKINTSSKTDKEHRIDFRGTKGTMILKNASTDHVKGFCLTVETNDNKTTKTLYEDKSNAAEDGRIKPVSRIVERFAKWIRTGIPEEPSFEKGLRVQKLLDATRESFFTRTRVTCLDK